MLSALAYFAFAQNSFDSDRAALTAGVDQIVAPGALPGPMSLRSKDAFVVLTGRTGKNRAPLFLAAHVSDGRVLAGGHEGFYGPSALQSPGNARFLSNSLSWLAGNDHPKVGQWDMPAIPGAEKVDGRNLSNELSHLDVICMTQSALDGDVDSQSKVMSFVRSGHGLLIAGPAWGWLSINPSKSLRDDHAGNRMLGQCGIGFADGSLEGPFSPEGADNPLFEPQTALDALAHQTLTTSQAETASETLEREISLLPPGDNNLVREIDILSDSTGHPIPTMKTPITSAMPLVRLNAVIQWRNFQQTPPQEVQENPAAEDFPGPAGAAPNPTPTTRNVDTTMPGWHSMGLYAAAGKAVRIDIPERAAKQGLSIRIGPQTDTLWGADRWTRFPEISIERPLNDATNEIANPFGGTIYLVVPEHCKLGTIGLQVGNTVPAPHFVLGQTSDGEWKQQERSKPAPWTELEGKYVILSVPSSVVRDLDNPTALMKHWDQIMLAIYHLYHAPIRNRPERYCVDRQISAGYMHSGYPIMTFEDVAKTFIDTKQLEVVGGKIGSVWGFYHEMGHNFQQDAWTWDGCGEVTNNLFSLYGAEVENKVTPATYGLAHPAMDPAAIQKRLAKYLADGAKFSDWQNDPFLALSMYAQLREGFGWAPFTQVFGEYFTLKPSEEPHTEIEKHDQWMVRFSEAVHRNLGPFFQAWGVPTSDQARASIAPLPTWMPSDWPK